MSVSSQRTYIGKTNREPFKTLHVLSFFFQKDVFDHNFCADAAEEWFSWVKNTYTQHLGMKDEDSDTFVGHKVALQGGVVTLSPLLHDARWKLQSG